MFAIKLEQLPLILALLSTATAAPRPQQDASSISLSTVSSSTIRQDAAAQSNLPDGISPSGGSSPAASSSSTTTFTIIPAGIFPPGGSFGTGTVGASPSAATSTSDTESIPPSPSSNDPTSTLAPSGLSGPTITMPPSSQTTQSCDGDQISSLISSRSAECALPQTTTTLMAASTSTAVTDNKRQLAAPGAKLYAEIEQYFTDCAPGAIDRLLEQQCGLSIPHYGLPMQPKLQGLNSAGVTGGNR
ncbi:hypothetical protein MMC08_003878 [Hypocenomyce scalaris]|nr:hypothetical protein [Hypocenomyce scalaris]